jgi:hypothetical protein
MYEAERGFVFFRKKLVAKEVEEEIGKKIRIVKMMRENSRKVVKEIEM